MNKSNNDKEDLKLIKVDYKNPLHNKLLFKFLREREFNISHKNLPTYQNHLKFIKNNPYRKWFLISHKKNFIGSIYILYDNGIGLDINSKYYDLIDNIMKIIFSNIAPLKAIPSIRMDRFHMNINPSNKALKDIIGKQGAVLQQQTFLFKK